MKGYETWSFKDRAFILAVGLSLLWHGFWFFFVTITVSPPKKHSANRPPIVSLGPVLDDTILRTLVDTKIEASPIFYRRLADFGAATELAAQTLVRHSPGDVVSIPLGRRISGSLRDAIGGEKTPLEEEFAVDLSALSQQKFEIEGDDVSS